MDWSKAMRQEKNLLPQLVIVLIVVILVTVFAVIKVNKDKEEKEASLVPAYVDKGIDMKEFHYSYTSYNGCDTFEAVVSYDKNVYTYYSQLGRYYDIEDYPTYVLDEYNLIQVRALVNIMKTWKINANYSDYQMVEEAVNFVHQNIKYTSDMETKGVIEYPKYPVETLFEGCGDCEDTSVLLAAIIKELGHEVILLGYEDHMAIGVKGGEGVYGTFYEYNGEKYYYVETTATGWTIGDVPEAYANKVAEVVFLK